MKTLYIFTLILFCIFGINAQNCFTDYQYYKSIDIDFGIGQSLNEATTFALPIDTKSLFEQGKLDAEGTQFIVTDGVCNTLPFFIDKIPNYEHNVLYVKIPQGSSQTYTVHLYYGSSTTQVSQMDGQSVFDFFDDFEDGIVDFEKWETVGDYSSLTEENGQLKYTGSFGNGGVFKYITPKQGFTTPTTSFFIANANSSQFYGVADTADIQRIGFRYNTGDQTNDTLDIYAILHDTINGGSSNGVLYPFLIVERNVQNIISFSNYINDANQLTLTKFENHSTPGVNRDTLIIDQFEYAATRPMFSSFGTPIILDYIGISKAANIIPEITENPEQMIISNTAIIVSNEKTKLYPQPAVNTINYSIENNAHINKIEIYDTEGSFINVQFSPQKINTSMLKTGLYYLKIYMDGQRIMTHKILIQK